MLVTKTLESLTKDRLSGFDVVPLSLLLKLFAVADTCLSSQMDNNLRPFALKKICLEDHISY